MSDFDRLISEIEAIDGLGIGSEIWLESMASITAEHGEHSASRAITVIGNRRQQLSIDDWCMCEIPSPVDPDECAQCRKRLHS